MASSLYIHILYDAMMPCIEQILLLFLSLSHGCNVNFIPYRIRNAKHNKYCTSVRHYVVASMS
jgi:hypothetical protein